MIKLALLNLLPDNVYDQEDVARQGLILLQATYPDALAMYGKGNSPNLHDLALARNCLASGGRADTRRAASIFLNDIRDGRLGPLTLEKPPREV